MMKTQLSELKTLAMAFAQDEEGAQVIEYALIIAVVSIALVVALSALSTGTSFTDFVSRVTTCLTSTTAGACK
jgi:pilus assembly protein Flp/PilA